MEQGLIESIIYSYSLLKPLKFIEDLENYVSEVLSEECKNLITEFQKEFRTPAIIFDLENLKDFENLKKIYQEYKKDLKGLYREIIDLLFFKISRKVYSNKKKFETKWDNFLEVNPNFEFLDITSVGEILNKEDLSINLFTIFITFLIFELHRFKLMEKFNETEKEIYKKMTKWNPRIYKLLEESKNKIQKLENSEEIKKEILKFFDEKIKEVREEILKEKNTEIADKLSREFTKILRFVGVTLKEKTIQSEKRKIVVNILPENHIFYVLKLYKTYEKLNLNFNDIEKDLKFIFAEGYKIFKGESSPYFENFLERKILGVDIKILDFYLKNVQFIKETLSKLFELKLLERKIFVKPYEDLYEDEKRNSQFIYFSLVPKGGYIKLNNLKRIKVKIDEPQKLKDFINKNKQVISVLVYDIRGSTFMSIALFNAQKELSIKKKFQEVIKNSISSYGGFPVKETGDGGISFFAENSNKLYKEIFEETILSGHKMRFQKAISDQLLIKPEEKATERAILCAIELLEKSEEFIRKHYPEYRGFFPDVLGKDIPLKSLFRLGIGIFSGKLEKDIYLSFNSFGDFDIQGPIPNLAYILSEVKLPDSSTILLDIGSLTNLIINSNIIEIEEEVKEKNLKDLLLNCKTFKIKNKNFTISYIGYLELEELNKDKMLKFEKLENIELIDDFFVVNNKKVIPIYGGKR
ncbi:MAG: hypothetical protein ABDH37_08065 [Candidatus Hydrothermales bacterium]